MHFSFKEHVVLEYVELQTALKAKVARVRRTKGLLKTGVFATCVCKTLVLHTQVAKTGQKTKAELCLKE